MLYELYITPKKSQLTSIHFQNNKWILRYYEGNELLFDHANLLIENELFSLIKMTIEKKTKLIVLFKDQLSMQQLQLLNHKILGS